MIQVRVQRRRAIVLGQQQDGAASVHETPPKRYSVCAISDGAAVNGALSVITLSRCGTLVLRVAVVERLGPHEGRRRERLPLEAARPRQTPPFGTCRPPAARRSACTRALAIPDFDGRREVRVGHEPRIRPLHAADEDEVAVGRRRRGLEHARARRPACADRSRRRRTRAGWWRSSRTALRRARWSAGPGRCGPARCRRDVPGCWVRSARPSAAPRRGWATRTRTAREPPSPTHSQGVPSDAFSCAA